MNILKKIISITLILTQLIIISAMSKEVSVSEDAVGNKYESDIKLMLALGIMSENDAGEFLPDATVTRAEFAQIIAKALSLDGLASSQDDEPTSTVSDEWQGSGIGGEKQVLVPKFSDVPLDYWAYNYINTLAELKLMGGYEDNKFQPELVMSYEQMLVVMVKALGLDLYARSKGGYPTGYLMLASNNRLTNIVNKSINENLTRSELAALLSMFLTTDITTQSSIGDNIQLGKVAGQNLLTESLKIRKAKGVVTGNNLTTLYSGGEGAIKGRIKIDGEIYISDAIDISQLLGKHITYYYRTDEANENKIVLIDTDKDENIITSFDIEDFLSYNAGYVEYQSGDELDKKILKCRVADDVPVIFNGVFYTITKNLDFSDLRNYSTNIRLLDRDNDSKIDVVFIDSYKTYVIRNVDLKDSVIYVTDVCSDYINYLETDRRGYASIDLSTQDKEIRFFKDGSVADETSLKSGRIVSIGESRNSDGRKWVTVQVSTATLVGGIDSIDGDKFTISGQELKRVPNAKVPFSVKLNGTFYLDFTKRIAYYNQGNSTIDYAFLVDASIKNDINRALTLKMFTQKNGKVEKIQVAEKVSLNEGSLISSDGLYSQLLDKNSVLKRQFIAYSTNKEGLIRNVYTATVYTNWSSSDNHYVMQRNPVGILSTYTDATGNYGPGSLKERTASRTNFEDFLLSKTGTVFDLSADCEEDWKLQPPNFVKDARKYKCVAYNISVANVAQFMVLPPPDNYSSSSLISGVAYYDDKSVIISKVTNAVDAAGNRIYNIEGYKYGASVKYTMDLSRAGTRAGQFQVGDCWQIEAGADNKIIKCTEIFDINQQFTADMPTYRKRASIDDVYDSSLGFVREIGEEGIVIGIDTNDTFLNKNLLWTVRLNQWGAGSTNVAWYDVKTKKLEVKTTADIMPDDLVFAVSAWNTLNQILVIKNFKK